MPVRGHYAKGIAKREEILDVALELFTVKGYDRTSVREIARAAGLSQAGVLHHFSTKEELFIEVLRRRDVLNREAFRVSHDDPNSISRMVSIVRQNMTQPGLVRLYVTMSAESTDMDSPARSFFEERYRSLRAEVANDVRKKQELGEFSSELDPDAIASLLIAAADGLQIQWLLEEDGPDMGALIDQLWTALRHVP
jgi:AcrR family transcriptional regulator